MIIYFKKPVDWTSAYIHYWATTPGNLESRWPGIQMTSGKDGWYCFSFKNQTAVHFVLNDGNQRQTRNLFFDQNRAWFVDDDLWDVPPDYFSRFAFPNGKYKALVMSYDDGNIQDERLIDIFNSYGIKGSFHLNSGLTHEKDKICAERIQKIYQGHEVSVHSKTHSYLDNLDAVRLYGEVMEDKFALERLTGCNISGIAYPFGPYSQLLLNLLKKWGFVYGRVVDPPTNDFRLPADPLVWRPCCHQSAAWEHAKRFITQKRSEMSLLLIWGHSHELDGGRYGNDWEHITALCKLLGRHEDIWYTTFADMAGYIAALRALIFSPNKDRVYNASSISVWIKKSAKTIEILPKSSLTL